MQNNVNTNISWYEGHNYQKLGQKLKFSNFYVQNIWQVVRRWHHQLTHLHIHTDWSRNVSWKFAKLQHFITSLFFNRFSSGFHCFVQKILLFLLKLIDQLRTSPLNFFLNVVQWTSKMCPLSNIKCISFSVSLQIHLKEKLWSYNTKMAFKN